MRFALWFGLLRVYAWRRWRVPLPAEVGWWSQVRAYARVLTAGGVWAQGGIAGAPVEWCLLEWCTPENAPPGATERLTVVYSTCAKTGKSINGAIVLNAEGRAVLDTYGVRCARCGVPLHVSVAGMATSADVPSCRACRPLVRLAVLLAPL